ncbi:MAG: NADPH:quinone oxidoreductase family protein [Hyphomicrobiales bacterium]|nr:NADPH:quinone oxidoreductase family protein [Hyphomicrobiales bacterium]
MRAVLSREPGPPRSLVIEDIAEPTAEPGMVVVAVDAVGLNFFDTLIIEDRYQVRPPRPFSPGAEIAGTVEAVGEGVETVSPGDRVIAYLRFGGCREKALVSEEDIVLLPAGVAAEAAAGLTVTYGTTLHALRDRARLQPGETVAVLGASGGVGQAAIEIAKVMGARVIACASSAEKLDFCRSLGADETVDYSKEDLKTRLKDLTDGAGVDIVYDPVGGTYAEAALRATGWQGRYLVVGFAAGEIPKIPLNLVLLKGCDVLGVFWGESIVRDPDGHRANMTQLLDWIAAGAIKPHIHATYRLDDTAAALEALAERKVKGKVIVLP